MTTIQVMTEHYSLAHTKAHLSEIIDEVEATQEHVVITRRGKPAALVIGVDEYESIMETLDALATPGLLDDLKQAEADYAAGKYYTIEDIKRDLENRRE
ncbi:MAG: prevent-host-death family [Actinobacteria bacterium]|nr:MAG: prevent-host-death family [Actinomycetota bacterium]MDO8950664.1 type II toxin-antitoxin system Phd/YefM family antitoxin [Actinomycetota bacterium]